jgi:hypothetical protein
MSLLEELYTERRAKLEWVRLVGSPTGDFNIAEEVVSTFNEIDTLNKEIARLEKEADDALNEWEEEPTPTVYDYIDINRMHSFESYNGVNNLKKLLKEVCGYGKQAFGPDALNEFLADNSGAVEAIINWISQQDNTEWNDNISDSICQHEDWEPEL